MATDKLVLEREMHNLMRTHEATIRDLIREVQHLHARPFSYGALSADQTGPIATVGQRLMGYSLKENAGAVANIIIRHGRDANSEELADIRLAANESTREWFGPGGIDIPKGLFFSIVSGAVKVTVYTAHEF